MRTENIEVILRALELGSMTKAASEYQYTASALSHILRTTEDEIGAKIIKRTHAGIATEDGSEEIVEELKNLLKTYRRIKELAAEKNMTGHSLTIGTYASLSKYVLPKIVKGYMDRYPHSDIRIIVEDNMRTLYAENGADIYLCEKIEGEGICWEEIMTDPYVAVLPKANTAPTGRISRETLAGKPFIMANDTKIAAYMEPCGIRDLIQITSHDDSSVVQMVKEGLGVSVLPSLSVRDTDGIVCAPLEPVFTRILGLVYTKKNFHENKNIRHFAEYIRTYVGKESPKPDKL